MLSAFQRKEFEETGVLRLARAVEAEPVARMRDLLWEFMTRVHGFVQDDPATWEPGERPSGFQQLVRSDAFSEMASPGLCAAADELLGAGSAQRPNHWGPPLPAFPETGPWCVPHDGWHMDVWSLVADSTTRAALSARPKALQLTSHSALQSSHGKVWRRALAPSRWTSALCGAAERPVRWAA